MFLQLDAGSINCCNSYLRCKRKEKKNWKSELSHNRWSYARVRHLTILEVLWPRIFNFKFTIIHHLLNISIWYKRTELLIVTHAFFLSVSVLNFEFPFNLSPFDHFSQKICHFSLFFTKRLHHHHLRILLFHFDHSDSLT